MTPRDIQIRNFKCGITDPQYATRLGLSNFRFDTVAFNGEYAETRDPITGAFVAPADGNPIRFRAGQTRSVGNRAGDVGDIIQGSFAGKDPASTQLFLSGFAPLNQCYAIFGVMVHPRVAYQAYQSPVGGNDTFARIFTPFLFTSSNGSRFVDTAFHELLESISVQLVNTENGKLYDLGSCKESPDIFQGELAYQGLKPDLNGWIPLPCPIISGSTQTVDSWLVLLNLAHDLIISTDGGNDGLAPSQKLNTIGQATVFMELKVIIVGAVICCPPDKLCDFQPGITNREPTPQAE